MGILDGSNRCKPPQVKPNTLVLFIILFTFLFSVLTCMGIGYSIWVMYKLRDGSQPHRVDREFTLSYIALGSVFIVILLALLMWYLHQQQCSARWGFIKALFLVILVMVLPFIFLHKHIPTFHRLLSQETGTITSN